MTQLENAGTARYIQNPPNDQRIIDRCHALGLTLLQAVQLANADDPADPQALLRVLGLDFVTYEPLVGHKQSNGLQMAAMSCSVSYRGSLTKDGLLTILTTGVVPAEFFAHIGHFLDEVSAVVILRGVEEAARKSQIPAHQIWKNLAQLAVRHSDYRKPLWALFAATDPAPSC